jgi:hypothetical protein
MSDLHINAHRKKDYVDEVSHSLINSLLHSST